MTGHHLASAQPGAATLARVWAYLTGGPTTPLGGGVARRRPASRSSSVHADSIVEAGVELVTQSAQLISLTDTLIVPFGEVVLHHAPSDSGVIGAMWRPIRDAVQAGVDDWATTDLDGASLDVEVGGPFADPTLRPGAIQWLTALEHDQRLARLRADAADKEREFARRDARERTGHGRLGRIHGEAPDEIRLTPGAVTVIGRDDAFHEDAIAQVTASRRHLEITLHTDGRATARDLGSANGTCVDDVEIQAPADPAGGARPPGAAYPLRDGAVIRLGRSADSVTFAYRAPLTGGGATVYQPTVDAG